jgi:oxygen-dependent protoporphyrinogen oxidase
VRVGIVGAGIGGLALAYELRRRGIEPVVHEAEPVAGGVIRSIEQDGRILEAGPQRTRLTPSLRALVDELGLQRDLIFAPRDLPLFIYRERLRRAPLTLSQLAGTDLFGVGARLRILVEPLTGRMRPDETVAAALTRRFGRRAYEDLLGPLFGGLYASDPADMPVRHALAPMLRDLRIGRSALLALALRRSPAAAVCSFEKGLGTLISGLHQAVANHVTLSSPVHEIRRASAGYILDTATGPEQVDRVVLTCPAHAAASLLHRLAPDTAQRLAALTYNSLAVVHLESDEPPRGLGFQVSLAEGLKLRGATFNHALFGATRARLSTAFLGGAHDPSLTGRPDDRIADLACREFEHVTGRAARAVLIGRVRLPAWDRSWAGLEDLSLPAGLHLCANYESRIGIGGRLARAVALANELTAPSKSG